MDMYSGVWYNMSGGVWYNMFGGVWYFINIIYHTPPDIRDEYIKIER